MRRAILLILFVVVLGLPYVLHVALGQGGAGSSEKGTSTARLVIVTPHNQDIRREFERAFNDWHAAKYGERVELDYRVPGGTVDIKRLLENTYGGYRDKQGRLPDDVPADIDVAWGGGDYFFNSALKKLGLLQPMRFDLAFLNEAFPQDQL